MVASGPKRWRRFADMPLSGYWRSSSTVTVRPPSGLAVRLTVPAWARVMLSTIARPRPTPAWSVWVRPVARWKGSVRVATTAGLSISPVFSTVRTACPSRKPVVIHNLAYWGAPRNDGFVMMPNEVEAYRVGPKAYEFKGTNGFMINIDMNSNDVAAPASM